MNKPENKAKASHASTKWQRSNPQQSVPYNRANAAMVRVKRYYPEALHCNLTDTLPIYELAYQREVETGIRHHVDHRRPLMAGGIHHPSNFDVLTVEEHLEKTMAETRLIRMLMSEYYDINHES